MSIQSINPYNYKINQELEPHSDQFMEAAVERAHDRFTTWKVESFKVRSDLFMSLAAVLKNKKAALAKLMTLEMGKLFSEAEAEVEKCAWVCEYYAEHAEKFLADDKLKFEDGEAFVSFDPLGVALAVMPWNFPLWQVFRFAAPSIMAGNTALLKHASNVPLCALAIEEVFLEAGFPQGVFQTLLIGADKVQLLLEDDRVKAVSLTGGEKAGSMVAKTAGEQIKPVVLELGGSDAFVVLDDADIAKTARIAAQSRMINCGQSCIAAKRFIVVERIYDEFLEAFTAFMKTYELGDPMLSTTKCGPMAMSKFVDELEDQVQRSIRKGATPHLGGTRAGIDGDFFQTTILTEVTKGMPAYDEEMFGPVAAVIKVKNEEEAIAVANDSRFGLGGSVWTEDKARGIEVARKIVTGAVYVNRMTASDPRLPFGGIGKSGFGRELSHYGIKEFVNAKTIVAN
ncbi:NAD-dependent succinate-semialdehyde dehydrogenase [Roseivirga pacifica]